MVVALVVALPGTASAIMLNFVNNDGPGEGFNDPVLGPDRVAALTYSMNLWGHLLVDAYPGETINVLAQMDPLGGTATRATLGWGGVNYVWREFGSADPAYLPNTWYGDPLANHLNGGDLRPGMPEVAVTFNSDVDNAIVLGSVDWYYGTDANPGGHIDFPTVAIHEIGHGLNFFDLIAIDVIGLPDGAFLIDDNPGIYDRNLILGATGGTPLTAMSNAERAAAVISDELYWFGSAGVAANGGVRPKIYAPNPYEPGSSVAHLDETVFPNELMSPFYSGPDHRPSGVELGMLKDMGWAVIPEPGTMALAGLGVLAWLRSARRRKRAA